MGTKCGRSAFYNGDPVPSMISSRDRTAHDRRRRVWSPAFGDKALRDYAKRIKIYDDQLISRINAASSSGSSMNASKWFNYYSFDAMGDLAFGKSFNMLQNDQEHWAVGLLNSGLEALRFLFPIWLFRVLISIPGLLRDHERIVEFCSAQLDKRMKVLIQGRKLKVLNWATLILAQTKVDTADIMSTLLKPFQGRVPVGEDLLMLQGDARLIVIAGR
jgi:tryprostatin B 6-hydroxylase